MTEIPILFSQVMVQALMEGRKTQTRRMMKPQPDDNGASYMQNAPLGWEEAYNDIWKPWHWDTADGERITKHCPYGEVGDVLFVRESTVQYMGKTFYVADNPDRWILTRKKPSIHMWKSDARIWLQVTGIRTELAQGICTANIKGEGVKIPVAPSNIEGMVKPLFRIGIDNGALSFMPAGWEQLPEEKKTDALFYAHWAELWCEINGRASWDTNPWVWVVSFKMLSTVGRPAGL